MTHRPRTILTIRRIALALLLAALIGPSAIAQKGESYQTPPQALAKLVDAPLPPSSTRSPDGTWLMLLERPGLPTIEELAQPELKLAGTRINPRNHGRSRGWTLQNPRLIRVENGESRAVSGLPKGNVISTRWSPDSRHAALALMETDGISLWLVEIRTAKARALTGKILNGTRTSSMFDWLSDNQTIIARVKPEGLGQPPVEPTTPKGPNIQETTGKKAPARTYQDLLKNPHDEALFEHYFTAQVAKISLDGAIERIGAPGVLYNVSPSPDSNYLLVETLHRPFSYLVPASRFPVKIQIWDMDGKLVREIADLPLAETIPKGFMASRTGPRQLEWRGDAPAVLVWAEAQDEGDPKKKVEVRDRLFSLNAPFNGEPQPFMDFGLRYGGVYWGSGDLAMAVEYWWTNRKIKTWTFAPDKRDAKPNLLFERSLEDRYNDPGDPATHAGPYGAEVLMIADDGKSVYMTGSGASPEGNRPFLDKLDAKTGKTQRLWRSQAPHYERVLEVLDNRAARVLTLRESKSEPPNYFVRTVADGKLQALTDFPHPTPELASVSKELIKYQRDDGVQLTATLYLPPGYKKEDGPLPMLMWAYPTEFKSADAAGQVTDSPHRFTRVSYWAALPYLAMGYGVLDDPSMPIIGEGDQEPNDTYVQQLVSSAKAAIDEVVRRGVAHPDHIAIGGHSYGAFMTANLLAHSDLFRAGIARSGAYNRSLTPFGFQAEERTFWEGTNVYAAMSPFFHAPKINEPILFIHGEMDNNSGTFPLQSRRMFQAVKGLGGTARLVMLPFESHGYRARESNLHMLWEQYQWLEKYVRPPKPAKAEETAASGPSDGP